MVKVTGKLRDAGHVQAHLDYISRRGALDLEGAERAVLTGRGDLREVAEDWAALSELARRRAGAPVGVSLVLSMPAGADPVIVQDAVRAFADEVFGARFDHVFVLHTDAPHPHVHLAVCAVGDGGAKLGPKKADLDQWRQVFARALRDRGVEAEATPRRTRGVTLKAERTPLRKIRERHQAGLGDAAWTVRSAYQAVARATLDHANVPAWERRLVARQAKVRKLYLEQARILRQSPIPADRELAMRVEAFVEAMPRLETRRWTMIREVRAAKKALVRARSAAPRERETPR